MYIEATNGILVMCGSQGNDSITEYKLVYMQLSADTFLQQVCMYIQYMQVHMYICIVMAEDVSWLFACVGGMPI